VRDSTIAVAPYIMEGIRTCAFGPRKAMPAMPLTSQLRRHRLGVLTRVLLALCVASVSALLPAAAAQQPAAPAPHYTGSAACQKCHAEEFAGWKQSRMANVVTNPHDHPEAVLGDFTKPDPARTFTLDDVAFTYGSRWKQRYFTKRGDDYYPLPAQWDIKGKRWLPYQSAAGTDWWLKYYGPTNMDRPTGPTCDGCHSVNYNIATKQVTEWNVGCEKCHGPGSAHVANPTRTNIVNPETLDYVRGNDTCIQCHSQGRPTTIQPTPGHAYDWPVGYEPGKRLADFWALEELKPGTTNFFQYADLTAHKNRMQGNDFAQSNMYHREMRCFDCHQVHGNSPSLVPVPTNQLCLGCHTKENPAGLRGTVAQHTHHAAGSAGSQCAACHMPKIEQTIKDNAVSAHTFRFITPGDTERSGIPNPCTTCHADKSTAWARDQLRAWNSTSPWRVAQ
jgi:predicted CXXCH cytochrome family protein